MINNIQNTRANVRANTNFGANKLISTAASNMAGVRVSMPLVGKVFVEEIPVLSGITGAAERDSVKFTHTHKPALSARGDIHSFDATIKGTRNHIELQSATENNPTNITVTGDNPNLKLVITRDKEGEPESNCSAFDAAVNTLTGILKKAFPAKAE